MAGNYDLLVSGSLNSHQVKSGGSEVMNMMMDMMTDMMTVVVVPCFHRS
jgi:hypothetical protein